MLAHRLLGASVQPVDDALMLPDDAAAARHRKEPPEDPDFEYVMQCCKSASRLHE